MRVEQVTEDDWTLVRTIRLRGVATDPDAFGASPEREHGLKESHWRMRLRASPWFVASIREEPVGIVSVISEPGAPPQERHLVGLWVSPNHRGVGVGDGLLRAAEDWAIADGGMTITLWLMSDNGPAARLCRRNGYAPSGVRMTAPRDPARAEEQWVKALAVSQQTI